MLSLARSSHHGQTPVHGRLRWAWLPHLAATGEMGDLATAAGSEGLSLSAEPFVLSEPADVAAALPSGWMAGRLRLWLQDEATVLAATSLDVVRRPA